tara:strand:- start:23100 stop:23846 length:747 start_codon:yes stop_codon:yes gene_type:complete
LTVIASGDTHIGMKRKTNQDSICVDKDLNFFVVADGMGGHNGGDIASSMSVDLLPNFIRENQSKYEVPVLLDNAVHFVNNAIYEHGLKNSHLEGMGTTISAIMFNEKHINIANIGDSRVYMLHKQKLYQLTRDHSLVQERLNIGFYDREGARKDPQKNVLIKTVGFENNVRPDVYQYKVNKNDLFLICSDGLHGKVADQDIVHIITNQIKDFDHITQADLDNCVSKLIDQANANGGQDNISVILAAAN